MSQWQSHHFICASALATQRSFVYHKTLIAGATFIGLYIKARSIPGGERRQVCQS